LQLAAKDRIVIALGLAFAADFMASSVLTHGKSACALLLFGPLFLSLRRVKSQPQNPRFWLVVDVFLVAVICFGYTCTFLARYPHSRLGHVLDLIGLLLFLMIAKAAAPTPYSTDSIDSKELVA